MDKLCDIITNLSLQNFRLRNRTMRKSISLKESISAAMDLNFKLYKYSTRGKGGEYIDQSFYKNLKSYHIGITKYQNRLSRNKLKIYEKSKSYQEVIIK